VTSVGTNQSRRRFRAPLQPASRDRRRRNDVTRVVVLASALVGPPSRSRQW